MKREGASRQGTAGTAASPGDTRMHRAWWFGAALVLAVLAATVAVAWNDLRVRREAGERYLHALAESHARQVGYRLDSIERAFHGLANGLEALDNVSPIAVDVFGRDQIARIASGHPYVEGLHVTQRDPGFVPADAPAGPVMFLGQPGPVADGHWVIPLAMPFLRDADGRPTRWLRADLDVGNFAEILSLHEVGAEGVSSVLTTGGILLARSDSGTRHAGLDANASPVLSASHGLGGGVVVGRSRLDGIERLVGYRPIDDRPLVATVGMTPVALYGGWRIFAATLAAGFAFLVGAWLLGMAMLRRAAVRESRMRRNIAAGRDAVGHLRERVRDAEAQYRFLFEQHPLPAIVCDRETLCLLEANDAAAQQFGHDAGRMIGLGADELFAADAGDEVGAGMRTPPERLVNRSLSMRRHDGSRFSAQVFARDLASFSGRPARLLLVLDVTDRERAEASLRLLRRAVDASEEGVFILAAGSGALEYGNAAFTRLTGVDADAHEGAGPQAVDAIFDADIRPVVRVAMERSEEVHVEREDRRDPDDIRALEIRLTPVLDGAGTAGHFVGVVSDITMGKRAAAEAAFRASHDALTGLSNRDCLIRDIDRAIAAGPATFVVCHLDLDRFQLVNDSHGHVVGDELLVAVARRLEAHAGPHATVARLGGDEFGILLPPDSADAAARVEALRMAVAGAVEIRGAALHVTPSVGYSRHPDDGADGTTLLRAAVQAGVQAKRMGRNRSMAYRCEFDSRAGERLLLVQELHRALERDEFELAFQLQFDGQGRPTGMEALARWRHPERGLLGPGEFMAACEDSGLVLPLGRWVLREAGRRWRMLDVEGWGALRVGVNISALQFQEGLVEDVAEMLAESGLPPGRLELELTESVLLASPADARRAMEALSALGASLAIDDFGTGYSSLAYLKHLPLQRLKVDQSFVRDLGHDADSEAICAAILRMAQGLGLKVIAEGVETPDQHRWLLEHGCGEFQGYLLARPASFDAVLERLRATT